jgi:hypothetical protein
MQQMCCLSDSPNIPLIVHGSTVFMGSVQREGTGKGAMRCGVERIWIHPEWNPKTKSNDMALLKIDCIVEANNPTIRPVALPKSTSDNSLRLKSEETVVVTGFGRLKCI